MNTIKILVSLGLCVCCTLFCHYWHNVEQPKIATDQSMRQLEIHSDGQGDRLAAERRFVTQIAYWPIGIAVGATFLTMIGLWWSDIRRFTQSGRSAMQKLMCLLFVLPVLISGCAYDKPVFVEWGSSVTPFLIKLEGDQTQATVLTEDLLNKSMIGNRRVQITYRWVDLGRGPSNGKYYPNERLILVDRDPVTREWTADPKTGTANTNQAIQAESKDSINFTVGMVITARIVDNTDAVKFLFNYPAGKIEPQKLNDSYKDDYEVKKVSLSDVMDTEIRARVQKCIQEQANLSDMDTLRSKKGDILAAVEKDILPFFKERGITVTTLGMTGGLRYENDEVQKSIDKVFQAQMDKAVALAETEAATQRKSALKQLGEGEASKAIEKAKGEATAIQAIADAKKYELDKLQENPQAYLALKQLELQQKALEIWDGRYPVFLMGGGSETPNLLLTIPKMGELPTPGPNANKAKHDAEKSAGQSK